MTKKIHKRQERLIILSSILLLLSIPLTLILLKQNQDIRNMAAGEQPCRVCVLQQCVGMANPPMCMEKLDECTKNSDCGILNNRATNNLVTIAQTPTPLPTSESAVIPQRSEKNILLIFIQSLLSFLPFKF